MSDIEKAVQPVLKRLLGSTKNIAAYVFQSLVVGLSMPRCL